MSEVYWVVHINSNQYIKWFSSWEEANKCAQGLGWCKVVSV